MIAKINISKVVKDHFATFRDIDNRNFAWAELIFFFALPVGVACVLVLRLNVLLSREILNTLIASFSVVVALLFNLLLLVYDIISKSDPGSSTFELKRRLLKEIYSNISYSILVSISAVIFMVIFFFVLPPTSAQTAVNTSPSGKSLSIIIVSLLINFTLTLLMILKRVHILLAKEME